MARETDGAELSNAIRRMRTAFHVRLNSKGGLSVSEEETGQLVARFSDDDVSRVSRWPRLFRTLYIFGGSEEK